MPNDPNPRLQEIFRTVLELDDATPVEGLEQAGLEAWDSLAHVLLVAGIEDEFEISVDVAEAVELKTYGDFAELVRSRSPGTARSGP